MPAQVTFIIPVYNAEPYLEQCLRSIADQTYTGWLAIVVNDGSTDGSLRVAERFAGTDKRFQVLTIPHAGQSAARNAGLEIVKSAYVCFLDADDWLDNNYLSTLLEHAGSYEVVQSGYRRVTHGYREPPAQALLSVRLAVHEALPNGCGARRTFSAGDDLRGCYFLASPVGETPDVQAYPVYRLQLSPQSQLNDLALQPIGATDTLCSHTQHTGTLVAEDVYDTPT